MNYNEAKQRFIDLARFGSVLGLERISSLLHALGDPQKELKFVHIAGTNGKGSTTTMLANILHHAGYRAGRFISPYVLDFRETMQVNGEMISETEFAACAETVFACADKLIAQGEEYPTQFEIETATALLWFYREKCDIVCLEVGLGGRFDATNVIPQALLQIITSISLDHTAILGDTYAKIAFEKAGIIKGGTTVLYPLQEKETVSVIEAKCAEVKSTLIQPDLSKLQITKDKAFDSEFIFDGVTYRKSLPGKFQVYNCITVITAAKELRKAQLSISDEDIRYGIEHTYFPARMEVLSKDPLIILDGTHNPGGAEALEQSLLDLAGRPLTILMGVLGDKDFSLILKKIASHADRFIAVKPDNPRALAAEKLCEEAKVFCGDATFFSDTKEAVIKTIRSLKSGEVLVICGSLYLAAQVRSIVLEKLKQS